MCRCTYCTCTSLHTHTHAHAHAHVYARACTHTYRIHIHMLVCAWLHISPIQNNQCDSRDASPVTTSCMGFLCNSNEYMTLIDPQWPWAFVCWTAKHVTRKSPCGGIPQRSDFVHSTQFQASIPALNPRKLFLSNVKPCSARPFTFPKEPSREGISCRGFIYLVLRVTNGLVCACTLAETCAHVCVYMINVLIAS